MWQSLNRLEIEMVRVLRGQTGRLGGATGRFGRCNGKIEKCNRKKSRSCKGITVVFLVFDRRV
jgi:hypothetical protein